MGLDVIRAKYVQLILNLCSIIKYKQKKNKIKYAVLFCQNLETSDFFHFTTNKRKCIVINPNDLVTNGRHCFAHLTVSCGSDTCFKFIYFSTKWKKM